MDQPKTTAGPAPRQQAWHGLSIAATLSALTSNLQGLSNNEAQERLQAWGANRLPAAAKRSTLVRFLSQFNNILIYVLLGAALITGLLGHWVDTGVIGAVVLVNAIIGFIQEGKAEQAMEAIRDMLAPQANIIRDGQRRSLGAEAIVPGDIVLLEAGDKVPADLRLISAHGLLIQEAILTGESVPVEKHKQPVAADAALADRHCMAFSGTLVSAGQAQGLVVATAGDTEIGRISGLLAQVDNLTTPLIKQMSLFAKWLTGFILLLSSAILGFGYFVQQHPFTELFMVVVGLSVAAIPEGLPAVLTITLAIGVRAMAQRNAIVRRLPAIETLGSVSTICTDKTGTLTRNEMMVASAVTHAHRFSLDGQGYAPEGTLSLDDAEVLPQEHAALEVLARIAALCNDAHLREEQGTWHAEGDPMEAALLAFAGKLELDVEQQRGTWARTDAIPFDAKHRFMATLNHNHDQAACIYVKGAPEQMLAMCQQQWTTEASQEPLDTDYWLAQAQAIANLGQRVLALAIKPVAPQHSLLEFSQLENDLLLVGLVGLIDPPRNEAIEAVRQCHEAGIDVKMITGDHAGTARAIGQQIGLQNTQQVLTGKDLDALDDSALAQAVLSTDVFARTSPEHKLRLVMALQAQSMTVAMTGDGVNDAPALKRADAGIAMGQKGSEAAKEAAELVLADDNFVSITRAVEEGRRVYDNLKKVISFLLPVNGGESVSLIIAILFGLTLPVTPVQILWINMVSSVALAMALAFEPAEPQVMQRPPRPPNAPVLSGFLLWRIGFVSMLFSLGVFGQFLLAQAQGVDVDTARTMTVNTLVVMEIFYLFSVRYRHGTSFTWSAIRGTPAVLWAVGIVTALQFLFTYAPFMQTFFASQPLTLAQGLQVIGFGVVVLVILEMEKTLGRRWQEAL